MEHGQFPIEPVAIVWRGDAVARGEASLEGGRFAGVAAALRAEGFAPEPCVYDERLEADVRIQLAECAAALVWVNPSQEGVRRRGLDELLRAAAAEGVLVSGHPDVIARLGVKAVLWTTREIGWSGDAHRIGEPDGLSGVFATRVAAGPRVLKPNRGNGGAGVWKVEALGEGTWRVQEAAGGAGPAVRAIDDFLADRRAEFVEADGFVDQAYQPRLPEGMTRCYMSGDRCAGFGHHLVRALAPPEAGPGGPRLYSGPDDPRFQRLRRRMEDDWTPRLCGLLGLAPADLPLIWDADFLLGPKDARSEDTFVLCEINASCCTPMPEGAPALIAAGLRRRLAAAAVSKAVNPVS